MSQLQSIAVVFRQHLKSLYSDRPVYKRKHHSGKSRMLRKETTDILQKQASTITVSTILPKTMRLPKAEGTNLARQLQECISMALI